MHDQDGLSKLVDYLIQRVEKMDEKVDVLIKSNARVIAGAIITSFFVTLFVQIAQMFISK